VLRALAANGLPAEEFAALAGPLGTTPKDTIYAEGTLKLQHYRPVVDSVYRVPVLMVSSLVNQPYILDLVLGRAWSNTCCARDLTSTWWSGAAHAASTAA
jgi:polyhydroxyalkanoate synthase subunit PhaC